MISEWVINEAQATIEKKIKEGLQRSEGHYILFTIANFLEDNYPSKKVISYAINEKVVITSRIIIQDLHIHASDALHVLIGTQSGSDYFITADYDLSKAIKIAGLNMVPIYIHEPEQVKQFFSAFEP